MRDRTIRLRSFCFGIAISFVSAAWRSPPAASSATTKVRHTDPGVCPPLPRRGPTLGAGHRGWARISAGKNLLPVALDVQCCDKIDSMIIAAAFIIGNMAVNPVPDRTALIRGNTAFAVDLYRREAS